MLNVGKEKFLISEKYTPENVLNWFLTVVLKKESIKNLKKATKVEGKSEKKTIDKTLQEVLEDDGLNRLFWELIHREDATLVPSRNERMIGVIEKDSRRNGILIFELEHQLLLVTLVRIVFDPQANDNGGHHFTFTLRQKENDLIREFTVPTDDPNLKETLIKLISEFLKENTT